MSEFLKEINSVILSEVTTAAVGIGSFVNIDTRLLTADKQDIATIWIYLADWALLNNEREILSTDMTDKEFIKNKSRMKDLSGKNITGIYNFKDGNEFHISFTGQYRLEIWDNPAAYGEKADLIRLFKNGCHASTLIAG